MNVISFSLWGKEAKHLMGALENLKLAKDIYPDWKCKFYVDNSISRSMVEDLKYFGGKVEIVEKVENQLGDFYGMFWRFFINDEPDVERYIIRDCDSRLNYREKVCVDEWMVSGKSFHTIHDHFLHIGYPILGGMWGCKKGLIPDMKKMVMEWIKYFGCSKKGCDQEFLKNIIWDGVKDNCLRHDNGYQPCYGISNKIPAHKDLLYGGSFIGEAFSENNTSQKPIPKENQVML